MPAPSLQPMPFSPLRCKTGAAELNCQVSYRDAEDSTLYGNRTTVMLLLVLGAALVSAIADEAPLPNAQARHPGLLELPPKLGSLLREEMRAIREGVRAIAPAVAVGDWSAIVAEAEKIKESYILNRRLSDEEARELDHLLPQGFKSLDGQFHARAGALAKAAIEHNADLVLHHYSRLLETCVACHSQHAASRFPELAEDPGADDHAHHERDGT